MAGLVPYKSIRFFMGAQLQEYTAKQTVTIPDIKLCVFDFNVSLLVTYFVFFSQLESLGYFPVITTVSSLLKYTL